ncbi:GntR family transcriptional regulator [Jannaschia pagri]|uniref:GntR family transcriptional regulator n=1 Tax=Jannaschia pagri TaxID=2829797 RepID=A0ABQ4NMW1_9RHOB|nr:MULTISPECIES: FCD domain-containing protein [unclassified Jannaschia]GIT91902.1 GntR family transcriptional regulator [Jannaschia sp. AI_61]GIT95736.1 GntR family transcriptional regulator [Jannaschia sp. AI_62]
MSDNWNSRLSPPKPLSTDISDQIAARIAEGDLMAGDRLPSETDLAAQFDCSRATVREALKRLAARNLIRTRRGHAGGAFVNRLTYDAAVAQHVATSTLLLSMNAVDFETAAEARFALERACADLACANHDQADLTALKEAIAALSAPCDDVAFCAADVAFHRAFVDAAKNPVLSYQLAGAVEAMQPLMNMITYPDRDRSEIAALYRQLANAMRARDGGEARRILGTLEHVMVRLFHSGQARRGRA